MKVQDVIDRAVKDPAYAAELIRKVSRLSATGEMIGPHNDENWKDIMAEFAESPDELARLSKVSGPVEGSTWWTTSVATVTTTTATPTSPVTVTTMTTMTTVQM